MPTLSLTCIETRSIEKAVSAVERTLACADVKRLYWVSTTVFPKPTPGLEVVNLLINDFTDFAGDINKIT
jgi:hypothetical protein